MIRSSQDPAPEGNAAGHSRPATRWVNIYAPEEMPYWERRLGVSRRLIVKAVREVGGDPIEVRKWLRNRAARKAP